MAGFFKLSPQGQRLVVMITSVPILVSTTWILYRRVIHGEDPRKRTPQQAGRIDAGKTPDA
ncbi:hypothetical protein THASP1DRAFT_29524 [Thamnocephalis sphaerospora]|uniref:Uncharacterized protein n=1 Tax=Thamnocephalis sphaerospora TaxID=78915 RepID=A0A4P9XTD1_9FUNG|nr:hypothetical protein THASP1DRAFT_29524 [Thamnocephalis sphaerospora]|eukprot:RKP08690.1 hypothetical protein THASP1DRAFT_29524 [Thamnocephalis sphaerospora]